jgi:PEP-CTERM motif
MSDFTAAVRSATIRFLTPAVLATGLLVSGSAHAAPTLVVDFTDDASAFIQANPGDQFSLNGFGNSVLLTSGVAQDVATGLITESLGVNWDDQPYATTVNHTLTLNGVGGGFSQLWQIGDFISPTSFLNGDGPVVYNVAGGTITVSMNAVGNFGNYSANMLYSAGGVPEPATWGLMIGGFGMAGAALRRRRTAIAAA